MKSNSKKLTGLFALSLSFASGLPTHASALKFDQVTYTSDPSDVIITVRGDEPPTAPAVKSYPGEVRVRFPSAHVGPTQNLGVDGRVLTKVELRQGSHETAVLTIGIGDALKVAESDVRVETRKNTTVFRIARDILPPFELPIVAAEEPAKDTESAPEKTGDAPAAAPEKALSAPAKTGAAPATAARPTAMPVAAKNTSLTDALSREASPMPMLLALSGLLGLAYLGLRLFMRKQSTISERPSIEVMAQKRLGARHQLIIVRAFGHDHLLSVQGGNTTPIATSEVVSGDEPALSLDSATRLVANAPAARAEIAAPVAAPAPAPEPVREAPRPRPADVTRDEGAMFGGELLRLAIDRRSRESAVERALASSDRSAVQAAPRANRIEQRLEPVAPEATGTDDVAPRGPQKEQALSKAVAGLVRLRREAR